MAKRLSAQKQIERLIEKGMSRAGIARAVGRDSSLISQIERGKKPGKNLEPALRELNRLNAKAREKAGEGKRELKEKPERRVTKEGKPVKVRQPKQKPAPPKETAIDKAQKQLDKFYDTDKVVIYLTLKETGRSITLGAHGGISVDTIRGASGGLGGFVSAQAEAQLYSDDDDPADWYAVEFEEYY